MLRGFDVSHWQGDVDWQRLKSKYGITFGAVKATEGTTFVDGQFAANKVKLRDAGLVRMFYHFARPGTSALGNADHFIDTIGPLGPDDLLVLDLEVGDGKTQEEVNAWAKTWATRVRQRGPARLPGIYMGSGYLTNRTGLGLNDPGRYYGWLWYPRPTFNGESWPSTFTPSPPRNSAGATMPWSQCAWHGPPDIWQFSWTVDTPDKDANVYNGTLAGLRSLNGDEMITPEDRDAIAKRVLTIDGLITNVGVDPATNPEGAFLTLAGAISNIEATQDEDHKLVAAIKTKVDALTVGGVDLDALAVKVADLLAERLKS